MYSLSAPSNKVGPETWRGDVNILFRAESTIVICSQYPEQPEQKSLLWLRLKVGSIYVYKHRNLEGSLIPSTLLNSSN